MDSVHLPAFRARSDAIDAVAIARAALREGLDSLPIARLAGPELDVRLLVDHGERIVAQRTALTNDWRWHLHDLWSETEMPPRAPSTVHWQTRLSSQLARAEQSACLRITRDEMWRIRELTRTRNELEHELAALVSALAPRLLAERGCGTLMAAKLLGEIAGVKRFATDAKLARTAGSPPVPASSGRTQPHRLMPTRSGDLAEASVVRLGLVERTALEECARAAEMRVGCLGERAPGLRRLDQLVDDGEPLVLPARPPAGVLRRGQRRHQGTASPSRRAMATASSAALPTCPHDADFG